MKEYYIAWWNLENLFDIEGCPTRIEKLKKTLENEVKGWTQVILDKKITQLGKMIKKMNNSQGPDLIGICEIENKRVIELLAHEIQIAGRNYQVVHHDGKDKRGIDIGFIYDASKFNQDDFYSYHVLKRTATRDLFRVDFTVKNNNKELILIGNHWPSRRGGTLKSEPYRIVAAETMAYWHSQIWEEKGKDVPILFMGDFNDDPFNRSMMEHALSTPDKERVTSVKTAPRLYNLMWGLFAQGLATFNYGGVNYLYDQFLVSKGFLMNNPIFSVKDNSLEIHNINPANNQHLDEPLRFGRPYKNQLNESGYSDHFPISVIIKEE